MRILVMSDSHGSLSSVESAIKLARKPDAIIFLGDGQQEFRSVAEKICDAAVLCVRGNCDYDATVPVSAVVEWNGVRILYTHGHNYGVRVGTTLLVSAAVQNECDIVLYGHTHCRRLERINNIYFFNPGSVTLPRDGLPRSAGLITLNNEKPPRFEYIEP